MHDLKAQWKGVINGICSQFCSATPRGFCQYHGAEQGLLAPPQPWYISILYFIWDDIPLDLKINLPYLLAALHSSFLCQKEPPEFDTFLEDVQRSHRIYIGLSVSLLNSLLLRKTKESFWHCLYCWRIKMNRSRTQKSWLKYLIMKPY